MQIVLAYDKLDDIRQLFQEYTAMLVETDETVKACLAAQGYGDELDHAEEKYGLPDGRLYGLCGDDGRLVGCAAIHRLDETCCELKRLYIQPACRGQGLSRLLMEQCIGEAKQIGYRQMRLDTLPFMTGSTDFTKSRRTMIIPFRLFSCRRTCKKRLDLKRPPCAMLTAENVICQEV